VLATWPLYLTCLVFAPVILRVFGEEFEAGAGAVRILAIALLVASACGPVESVLVMSGRSGLNLLNNVVALAVNIGLGLLLIPIWELEGAALAWAISVGLTNVLPLVQVHHLVGIGPFDGVMARTMIGLALAFAVGGIVGLAIGGVPGLVVGLAIAAAVAAPQIWRRRGELALRQLLAGEVATI